MDDGFVIDNSVVMTWCFKPERMIKEIFASARKHKLSSYGASYLDLAMRKGLPIATLDKNLLAAAKRSKVSILSGKY